MNLEIQVIDVADVSRLNKLEFNEYRKELQIPVLSGLVDEAYVTYHKIEVCVKNRMIFF